MKNLILAIALSIGSLSMTTPAVDAATITIAENGVRFSNHDGHHRRHWRRHHHDRRDFGRRHNPNGYYSMRSRHHGCRTRTVKRYEHHRVVYKSITVCGR